MSKKAQTGRPRGRRPYEFNARAAISARLGKAMTLRQVSERCAELGLPPVNDSNLAKYERGDICPSPPTLASLATVLGLQVSDLITFRENAA